MGLDPVIPDTNFFILGLKGNKECGPLLLKWVENDQLLISAIVVAEFLTKADPKEEEIFQSYLDKFPVPPITEKTAKIAAKIRKESLGRKTTPHLGDCLIAAQCLENHASLATFNTADFPRLINLIDLPPKI